MPNITSAKKALRRSKRQAAHNALKTGAYKKAVKNYRKLILAKKLDEAKTELVRVYKALDKAAKAKTIKKNKASRLKSRLAVLLGKSK